jgi:hypothetical protein
MGPLNRVIASSVPFMPKSLVGRVGRRYAAGEEVEDAVRVIEGLSKEGCLATVGMLGEHAPDERHTHERLDEYRRALDALEKQGFKDYRVAVKLTDLGLTLDRELCRKNLEEILLYARERGRFLEVDMEESPFVSPPGSTTSPTVPGWLVQLGRVRKLLERRAARDKFKKVEIVTISTFQQTGVSEGSGAPGALGVTRFLSSPSRHPVHTRATS